MFINPKIAIQNNAIRGVRDIGLQVQPNAVDFTLDKLMQVDSTVPAHIGETGKTMRPLIDVEAENGVWTLKAGQVYDGTSEVYVEVPQGAAAILFTRSTFARNGVFIVSGLYDSGYKGHVGFTIYPVGGDITIDKGTRIGQVAFISAAAAKQYAGGYNHSEGTHYVTDEPGVGQRHIPGDPRRTETGMGAILDPTGSKFL